MLVTDVATAPAALVVCVTISLSSAVPAILVTVLTTAEPANAAELIAADAVAIALALADAIALALAEELTVLVVVLAAVVLAAVVSTMGAGAAETAGLVHPGTFSTGSLSPKRAMELPPANEMLCGAHAT